MEEVPGRRLEKARTALEVRASPAEVRVPCQLDVAVVPCGPSEVRLEVRLLAAEATQQASQHLAAAASQAEVRAAAVAWSSEVRAQEQAAAAAAEVRGLLLLVQASAAAP